MTDHHLEALSEAQKALAKAHKRAQKKRAELTEADAEVAKALHALKRLTNGTEPGPSEAE